MIFYKKKRLVKHLKSEQDRLTQLYCYMHLGLSEKKYYEGKLDIIKDILIYVKYEL